MPPPSGATSWPLGHSGLSCLRTSRLHPLKPAPPATSVLSASPWACVGQAGRAAGWHRRLAVCLRGLPRQGSPLSRVPATQLCTQSSPFTLCCLDSCAENLMAALRPVRLKDVHARPGRWCDTHTHGSYDRWDVRSPGTGECRPGMWDHTLSPGMTTAGPRKAF